MEVVREASGSATPLMNASEYLEHPSTQGVNEEDLPQLQPLHQKPIWERFRPGDGPERLAQAIEELKGEDHEFHMEGGSWTNDLSWGQGYEDVLRPMEEASTLFYRKVIEPGIPSDNPRYRKALFHLMSCQTSCFRYWGQGQWTDYGREIWRRTIEILQNDL